MPNSRHVSLLASGQDQVLTIPSEFALSDTEVMLRKQGDTACRKTLSTLDY
ncbi:MAG: hypothetical protein WBA13_06550 [Microcoleaceae cyanobacterium]